MSANSIDIQAAGGRPTIRIFKFWAPLAATWLMMSVEGPLLAALISRLPEAKYNLAAYGVAFSFALVIEAPIIMMMSASTALVTDRLCYRKLRNFTWAMNLGVTAVQIILLTPPVFGWVMLDLVGLPVPVADLTHSALVILLPWPGFIGYRRFYQGILIRGDQTRRVAYGTVIRLTGMASAAALLFSYGRLPGAWVGAAALSCGVVVEAVASRVMVQGQLRRVLDTEPEPESYSLGYRQIWAFYYPLALTSILSVGVHPLITFMVARSRLGLESLAVLPVVNALVFIFRSLGLAYQEVGIALIGNRWQGYNPLGRFAAILATGSTLVFAGIAFTPLQHFWFADVSALSPELSRLAGATLRILTPIPALSILLCFQRSMLVNLRKTRWITMGTALEVAGLTAVLTLALGVFDYVGALSAAGAMVAGRLLANLFLLQPVRHGVRDRVDWVKPAPARGE